MPLTFRRPFLSIQLVTVGLCFLPGHRQGAMTPSIQSPVLLVWASARPRSKIGRFTVRAPGMPTVG